jgi:hypothetical protein
MDIDLLDMVSKRILTNSTPLTGFNYLSIDRIRICNVGQGNFILGLHSGNEVDSPSPEAVFDIGFTKEEPHNNYKDAVAQIEKLDNNGIAILSHWDLDHILGAIHAGSGPSSVWGRTWFLPELKASNSQSAKNFAMYLLTVNRNQVWFIPDAVQAVPPLLRTIGNIDMHQGDAKAKEGCTSENVRGLIAYVRGKNKTCLLPGDCIPSCFQTQYTCIDHLIVPHHGCLCNNVNMAFNLNAEAFVCVGENTYKHPRSETLTDLKQKGIQAVHRFDNNHVDDLICNVLSTPTHDFTL